MPLEYAQLPNDRLQRTYSDLRVIRGQRLLVTFGRSHPDAVDGAMIILKGQKGGHAHDETSPHRCYGFRCGVHRERLRQFGYVQKAGSGKEPGDRDLAAGKGLPGTDEKLIRSEKRRAETAGFVTGSAKGH